MVIRLGELWWASLPEPTGSEPGYRRPVLIVPLPHKLSGLSKDSVVNVSQLVTIDKTVLTEQIGSVPTLLMEQVEDGIKLVLGLG